MFVILFNSIVHITVHLFLFISMDTFELFVTSWRRSNKKFLVVVSVWLFSTSSLILLVNFKISGIISLISFSERFDALSFSCNVASILVLLSIVPIFHVDLCKKSKLIIFKKAKKVKKNRTFLLIICCFKIYVLICFALIDIFCW